MTRAGWRESGELREICNQPGLKKDKPHHNEYVSSKEENELKQIGEKGAPNPKKIAEGLGSFLEGLTPDSSPEAKQLFALKDRLEGKTSDVIIQRAESYLGKKGFDCSGFVSAVFGQEHIRSTEIINNYCQSIPIRNIQPGDVLFCNLKPGVPHIVLVKEYDPKTGMISFFHTSSKLGNRVHQETLSIREMANLKAGRVNSQILAQLTDKDTMLAQGDNKESRKA